MSAIDTPALFIASKAMPPVIAPSPMTATALRFSPLSLAAWAMPSTAEIDVDECCGAERVVLALVALGKARQAAVHAQRAHAVRAGR